ncbi:MAG: 50S ribosomal protein L9 [Prevotellaceae bacterium]|nr:50S ribosomal protein L9 [Prevotellaceae bacterium]
MEIILKEDVIGLGFKNDIVNVKPGYGRNYLLPRGLAILATTSAKKVLAENLRQQAQKLAKIKAAADETAAKLSGISLVIPAKVSATGVTYGSVNAQHISEELKKLGFDIDRKIIVVKEVKTLGHHIATVRLHKEVSVEIPFEVVEEKANEENAPATEQAPAAIATPAEEPAAPAEETQESAEETPAPAPDAE